MSDISLTASMRTNLLSLQNTQSLMDQTQERLSTGKKVNSAIDNPSSYYTAQSLTNRASDLDSLLDSMGQGIQTIQAANEGIEAITSFVQQAKAVANTARDTPATASVENSVDYAVGEGGDVTIKIGDKTFKTTIDKTAQATLDNLITKLNDATKSITADDGINLQSLLELNNKFSLKSSKIDSNSKKGSTHSSKSTKGSFNNVGSNNRTSSHSSVTFAKNSTFKAQNISSEINVIGQTVDEAIFVIDKYLDDCAIAKLSPVRIVHGKGTGKLREGIHKFLKTNSHVKSFRLGTYGEGEMGVTVVELK